MLFNALSDGPDYLVADMPYTHMLHDQEVCRVYGERIMQVDYPILRYGGRVAYQKWYIDAYREMCAKLEAAGLNPRLFTPGWKRRRI